MRKKFLNILKYGFFFGLGIFLVWWSLHKIPEENWPQFKRTITTARYWIFVPVFFILCGSHLVRAYRWRMLMQPLGYKPSLLNTFCAVMVGYLANMAVPRLGEVLKCTILARYEKVPADNMVGTIVAERAFDMLFLLILFVFALLFQYDVVMSYSSQLFNLLIASENEAMSILKIVFVLCAIVLFFILVRFGFERYRHLSLVISIKKILKGVWEGLLSVQHLQQKGLFILSSIAIWLLYIGGTWLGFMATRGTEMLGVDVAVSALAFGSIAMIITPGGFGMYAILFALILTKNNIPNEIALANGNLQWFAQFMIVLIVGFIALGILPYINKNKIHHEANEHNTR